MSAANPAKALLMLSTKFACASVCASLMFAAGAVEAGEPTPDAKASLPQPTDCRWSDLTSEEYLKMLHIIAQHGDLRDIAFTEKIFQVKFREEGTGRYLGKVPYVPAYVILNVYYDHIKSANEIASMNFEGDYFAKCSPFSASQIEKEFGGTFVHKTYGTSIRVNTSELQGVGKNGTKVYVQYTVNLTKAGADGIILPPIIKQFTSNDRQ